MTRRCCRTIFPLRSKIAAECGVNFKGSLHLKTSIFPKLNMLLVGLAMSLAAGCAHTPASESVSLSQAQLGRLVLYAELRGGYLEGKYFNENPDIRVTRITVETVPKNESNPFNKFSPRLFNIDAVAEPRSMTAQFRVETGTLNPDFHSLKVVEARGDLVP